MKNQRMLDELTELMRIDVSSGQETEIAEHLVKKLEQMGFAITPDTYEVEDLGKISESWIWSDAAPAPAGENGNFGFLVGLCNGGTYLEMIKPREGSLKYFSLTDYLADPMAAIAGTGSSTYQNKYPAENYLVVTESGTLWSFILYTTDGGKSYTLARSELGQTDLDLGNVSDVTGGSYASMFWDESSGYLILASYAGETTASLYAIDPQLLLCRTGSGISSSSR